MIFLDCNSGKISCGDVSLRTKDHETLLLDGASERKKKKFVERDFAICELKMDSGRDNVDWRRERHKGRLEMVEIHPVNHQNTFRQTIWCCNDEGKKIGTQGKL
jgi:hypothetical protein